MNLAMSHALMKGEREKTRRAADCCGWCVRPAGGSFPGKGARASPGAQGLLCLEHLEGGLLHGKTCRSASCVHHIASLTGED